MKGALYREFIIWYKSRSYMLILCLIWFALGVFGKASSATVTAAASITSLVMLAKAFSDDEKSNWNDYSVTLPFSSAQSVCARFLVCFTEQIIIFALYAVMTFVQYSDYSFSTELSEEQLREAFPYMTQKTLLATNVAQTVAIVLAAFALAFLINNAMKGRARTIVSSVVQMISVVAVVSLHFGLLLDLDVPIGYSNVAKVVYYENWLIRLLVAAAVLAVAASLLISVAIKSKRGRKKNIKLLAAGIAVVTVSALAVGFCAYTVVSNENYRDFSDNERYLLQFSEEKRVGAIINNKPDPSVVTEEMNVCRENMEILADNFCKGINLSKPYAEYCEKLTELGFVESAYTIYAYNRSGARNDKEATVSFGTDENELLEEISIRGETGATYLETATSEEMNALSSVFTVGMTEAELREAFAREGLYPNYISETYIDGVPTRFYRAEYYIGSLDGGDWSDYSVNVDVDAASGTVVSVRFYYR